MQVRTPSTGEVEEVESVEELEARWAKTSNQQWALFELMNESQVGSEEWFAYSKAFEFASKRNDDARQAYQKAKDANELPEGYRTVVIHKDGNPLNNDPDNLETVNALHRLAALLADAMERGEREAFDAYYDSQTLPCELDVVESDPWVEDKEAAIADEHADAIAFEGEARS